MSRIAPKTICVCDEQTHISVKEVEEHLANTGASSFYDLRNRLQELNVLERLTKVAGNYDTNLRMLLQGSNLPFRIRSCPNNYSHCCGTCVQYCDSRCVVDLQHRIWLQLASYLANNTPDSEMPMLARMLKNMLQPPVSYVQAITAIYSIINTRINPHLKERMMKLFEGKAYLMSEGHPHRIYYGPTDVKRNPNTGYYEFELYPLSGLCPFCIPTSPATHRYFTKRV